MIKKRSIFVAGIFNLVSPGLGFLYVGRFAYAVGLPLLLFILLGVSAWSKAIFSPPGFAVTIAIMLFIMALGVVSACYMAYRAGEVELDRYQKWYIYFGFIVLLAIVNNILIENRSELFGYETFRFPSGSMMDTLLPGDFVISNTWKYKTTFPRRGDLLVFRYPKDPSAKYIKRVIGIPGDLVEIANGKVTVNGAEIEEKYVEERNNQRIAFEMPGTYRVPEGQLFVMGDNRDNSNDSRF